MTCLVLAGVPPLVSRRVLEILTYLARNHSHVANLLLFLEPAGPSSTIAAEISPQKVKEKGKAKLVDGVAPTVVPGEPKAKGEIPLILLLKLLNQPLYSRSSAHLEQVGNKCPVSDCVWINYFCNKDISCFSLLLLVLSTYYYASAFCFVPSFGLVTKL